MLRLAAVITFQIQQYVLLVSMVRLACKDDTHDVLRSRLPLQSGHSHHLNTLVLQRIQRSSWIITVGTYLILQIRAEDFGKVKEHRARHGRVGGSQELEVGEVFGVVVTGQCQLSIQRRVLSGDDVSKVEYAVCGGVRFEAVQLHSPSQFLELRRYELKKRVR